MKLLEENYEINFSKVNFFGEKTKIENKKLSYVELQKLENLI